MNNIKVAFTQFLNFVLFGLEKEMNIIRPFAYFLTIICENIVFNAPLIHAFKITPFI